MAVAVAPTGTPTRALDDRTAASRHVAPAAHPGRHAPAGARWYEDAVFASLPATPPAAIVDGPAIVAALEFFRSVGATGVLLPVEVGPVRSLHVPGPPGVDGADVVQFERVLAEARGRDLRVLIDTRNPRRRHPHTSRSVIGAGRFWLRDGVDGVVVPDDAAEVLFACESVCSDGADPARWFTTIGGVPVPVGDGRLAALAAFRGDVPLAILEGIERGHTSPLLALLVELAVREARVEDRTCIAGAARSAEDEPPTCCPAATGRCSLDRARRRLFDRLLLSLPGPLLLPCDCSAEDREGGSDIGAGDEGCWNEMALLVAHRMKCAAFRFGQPLPVSLGGGRALAWVSEFGHEVALVAANLGVAAAEVQADLTGYEGRRVVDMISATELPHVTDAQYRVALEPLECRWFQLMPA